MHVYNRRPLVNGDIGVVERWTTPSEPSPYGRHPVVRFRSVGPGGQQQALEIRPVLISDGEAE